MTCLQTRTISVFVNDCQLLDLGFSGLSFTWTNNRVSRANIKQRIDRVFCNFSWKRRFQNHVVKYLPRVCSDHHPILIAVHSREPQPRRESGFKILEMWYRHPTFENLVEQIW